jgi:hypothetical protein
MRSSTFPTAKVSRVKMRNYWLDLATSATTPLCSLAGTIRLRAATTSAGLSTLAPGQFVHGDVLHLAALPEPHG